jgi:HEPN domain-containing protein
VNRRAAHLRTLAEEELACARRLLEEHPRQAAYLLQQAAEKLGKALLLEAGVEPPHSHAIGYLASHLPFGTREAARLAALDDLTVYAIIARYPIGDDLQPPPAVEHLKQRAAAVAELLRAALGP